MDLAPAAGWLERWQAWRDRLLASASFRRRALAFAPTRWVARRRARALFDLVAGFVYTQTLLACVRLRVFEQVAEGPATAEALAGRAGLPVDAARRLLDAAVALRLLEHRRSARYGLGPLGAAMTDNAALAAMVEHHATLYADLQDPVAVLRGARGEGLAAYWPYATSSTPQGLGGHQVAGYSALMSASQPLVADEVLDAYPVQRHQCLLDLGGGEGRFLAAAARRAPRLRLMLLDLPAVAERARLHLAAQGLAGRSTVVGGDFLSQPLPRGADLITLVRVVHDHSDEGARTLLRAVHEALPPGGVLLLAEPMAGTAGARAMGDAYFGLYLLAMGRGRPRSAAALTALLREAGFASVSQRPTRLPLQTGLLVACKGG
ncbi:MAG: methyltransferase [Burkholderiaceae bacterium]